MTAKQTQMMRAAILVFSSPRPGEPCSSIARKVRREARDARLQMSPPSVVARPASGRGTPGDVSLPAWVVGLYTLDGYQQVLDDDELAMESFGRHDHDATPIARRPPMATTIVEQTPMASAAALDALEDVMRQVVESQMGHPAASDRDDGEVHAVPQVEVCEVIQGFRRCLCAGKAWRSTTSGPNRVTVGSDFPALPGACNASDNCSPEP